MKVRHLDNTISTNDDAREALLCGENEVLITAKNQTAARGRRGRSFACKEGAGLYMSVGFTSNLDPSLIPEFSCVAGVAVAKVLEDQGVYIQLKWPNDLMLNGKKLGGILCEYVPECNGVIIGIGINLGLCEDDFKSFEKLQGMDGLSARATSLKIEGAKLPISDNLSEEIASTLLSAVKSYPRGKNDVLGAYKKYSDALGKEIKLYSKVPDVAVAPFQATVIDINENFSLLIRDEEGKESSISFGELSY